LDALAELTSRLTGHVGFAGDAPVETLPEAARRNALDSVAGTFKDLAQGKVKEAAERITQLGIDAVTRTPGFEVFKALADRVD